VLDFTRQCYDEGSSGKVTVDDFEAHRDHLRAVASRMLGSRSEADDAVQETWMRLSHADTNGIENTRAWLTTVVARVCLDMLRSRKARREVPVTAHLPVTAHIPADGPNPEQEAMLADSVGLAMLVVLDTLTPAERLAFVLHDMFAVPFQEIAPIVGRSTQATKMLASRARRRVRSANVPNADLHRQREVVDAFLAASRNGDFDVLLNVLDPDVTVRADASAAPPGTPTHLRGAGAVAEQALAFSHRAKDAHCGLVNGAPAILVTPRGRLATVMIFTISNGKILAIDVIADPQRVGQLTIEST
jgi:RNA polymerase sigma-70 factor (ECF subfamily)